MKQHYLFIIALMALLVPTSASAYSFKADNLYYNITSDSTVEVTCIRATYPSPYSGDIVIPETVTYEDVEYTVTRIGEFAFYGSYGLTSIVIPNTVTKIGMSSFIRCRSLTSIDIPNSVTVIDGAFSECTGLKSIFIPASVISLVGNPFDSCSGLESIVVDEDNPVYDSRENCNAIIQTATNKMIVGCKNSEFPSSVTSLGSWVFAGCTGLTEIHLPETFTSIPSYTFYNCTGLTSIEIPSAVTSIGYDAFRGCSNISTLELPESLRSIDIGAFSSMSSLTSLFIPQNVYNIGEGFLLSDTALVSLSVDSRNTNYDSREDCNAIIRTYDNRLMAGCRNTVIPNTVESLAYAAFFKCPFTTIEIPNSVALIDEWAFGYCSKLEELNLPSSVKTIGQNAFYNCESLEDVVIPDSVTSVGYQSFQMCYSLRTITFGQSVETVGQMAINTCDNLESVTMKCTTPPNANGVTNYQNMYDKVILYVPNESLEDYRAHEEWSRFAHIAPFIGAGPGDVDGDGIITVSDVTTLIDMLLSGEKPAYGDIDGDGQITISDVTLIIDMLLAD